MALDPLSTHQENQSSSHDGPQRTKFSTIYEQLDFSRREFRLLHLLPGKQSEPIICDLEVGCFDKNQCRQYEALSYVWGGIPGPKTIELRDQHIPVTSNLESALRHLRDRDHHRILWIDALCINQDDLQERNHQVRQMRTIYESASRVVAWLGPADAEVIDHIFRFASDETLHWTPQSPEGATYSAEIEDEMAGIGLFIFFNGPWWTRIWTVQEAAVAKKLEYVCGHTPIPPECMMKVAKSYLSHVEKCCKASSDHFKWGADVGARMKTILELEALRHAECKPDFLDVFQMNRYRESTEPRDMVYGLIGLTVGLGEEVIRYEATIQETYEQSTLEIINKSGNLDVFSHILGHPTWTQAASQILLNEKDTGIENLPSWVPDWSRKYTHTYLSDVSVRQQRLKLLHAGKDTRANVRCVAPGRLAVEGLDLLRVKQIGESKARELDLWSSWRQMVGIDSNPDRPYVAGGTILNAYWRTLCHDCSLEYEEHPLRRATTDDRNVHDEWWWNCVVYQNHESVEERKELLTFDMRCTWFQRVTSALGADRRFFISSTGYIGLVPSATAIGDRICVLSGGKTPYVLRPSHKKNKEDGTSSLEYTFVGDAYVHGLMDGEAFEMAEKGVLGMQTLILK